MSPLHQSILDGTGRSTHEPTAGPLWLHLDQTDAEDCRWLREDSGVDPVLVEALLADDTRPRSLVAGDGLFLILRGINVANAGDPEDMVALRMWLESGRMITIQRRKTEAVREIRASFEVAGGPKDAGEFLIDVVERMLTRIGSHVESIEDRADELEDAVIDASSRELRSGLSNLRRESIALRRYLAPQRETIGRLNAERVSWLNDSHRAHLRETGDRVTRYLETLDSSRERAAVTAEELSNRVAEQMNETMYLLSVVAAIFLPLSLLTGLLGINVGGMPGVDSPLAFGLVTVSLVVLGIAEWMYFRSRRMI